ncbi:MAG: hypothetical protein J0L78_16785 [Planctomycetes bacterium]|nr:hypothetical protein [Planctomycetota bacterium]
MIKKLLALVFLLIGLCIVAVVVAFYSIDAIAKRAIESGGTYALGVPTTVKSANVGIMTGTFGMSGLNVANPPGFGSSPFLSLGDAGVAVTLSSLREPVVTLPRLSLDNLSVSLEKKRGSANYNVILDNLKKLNSGSTSKSSGDGKKFIIRELSLRNINVGVDLIGGPGAIGDLTKIKIPISEIKLENVGQTGTGVGGSGVTMEQLTSIVVQAVLAAAAEKGGGILPAEILGDLQGGLANLGQLDKLGMKVLADPKVLEQLGAGKATEAIEQGKKAVDDAAKKVTDLIPGMKKEKK